ncbi:jg6740 [Pararge aegeria aegeria]|uniref:Jg6740 protein n=1 Tax=Pararge aegeria aegeria TaxID=348720 RepID=A0A8S4R3A0_9NEOP|nr:jg6740 [Pararge aegeria aegeria]
MWVPILMMSHIASHKSTHPSFQLPATIHPVVLSSSWLIPEGLSRRRLLSEIESEPILLGEDSARVQVLIMLVHLLNSSRRRDIRVENGLMGTSSHVITSTYDPGKPRRDKVLPYLKVKYLQEIGNHKSSRDEL